MRADAAGTPAAHTMSLADQMRADAVPSAAVPSMANLYQNQVASMSPTDRFIASAGGAVEGLMLGAKQRFGQATPQEVSDWKTSMAPLLNTRSGWWGNLAGDTAAAAPAMLIPGVNTYVGSMALGGALGAARPTSRGESAVTNAALGALGGAAGKYASGYAQRLANAFKSQNMAGALGGNAGSAGSAGSASSASSAGSTIASGGVNASASGGGFGPGVVPPGSAYGLNPAQQDAMSAGLNLGFRATPGQVSGSIPLQQVEAFMESHPATSGPFNSIKASNNSTLNRIWASGIGEDSPTLDSVTLGNAANRIGQVYEGVKGQGPVQIDPDSFLGKLAQTESDYQGLIGDGTKSITDHPLVKRFMNNAANGSATTEQLTDLASKLGKSSYNQMTSGSGDRQLGMALGDVKDHVDDVLVNGLRDSGRPDLADALNTARGQYRNLMLLTGRGNVVNPSSGNVNGRALASVLQQKDRSGFLFGNNQSPLYDAARFAQAFQPLVGDSGTATRMGSLNPMDWALSIPGNIASHVYTSGPSVSAAKNIAAALVAAHKGVMAASPVLSPLANTAAALGPVYPPALAALMSNLMRQDPTQP
jgi:hypothetical protein